MKKFKKNLKFSFEHFWNIIENWAFAPKEQMLHFP